MFQISDLDTELFKHLELYDILKMSSVNKYYKGIVDKTDNKIIVEYKEFIKKRDINNDPFIDICKNGLVDLATWWYRNKNVTDFTIYQALNETTNEKLKVLLLGFSFLRSFMSIGNGMGGLIFKSATES